MDYKLFSENLRVVRMVQGYGDHELSIEANLKHGLRISDIEGGCTIDPAEVPLICEVLGVSIHDMTYNRAVLTFAFKDQTE